MAERRGGTTARRRRRPRRLNLRCGQATMNAGGPSALANGAGGGLWRRGHDDVAHGGTPVRFCALRWLTKLYQRAREEQWGAGETVELWQWCWSGQARAGTVMATTELRELGGCCYEEERPRQRKNGVRLSAGGRWRDEGALGRVVAWLGRAEATRGRFSSMRRPWPDGGRPLNQLIQSVQTRSERPDSAFPSRYIR